MSITPRTVGLAGATALALVLLAPSAAQADGWGSSDPTGDVKGFNYSPDPQPCGTSTVLDASGETNEDISRLAAKHTRRAVVITLRFADLLPDAEQSLTVNLRASTGGYELDFFREAPRSGQWEMFADLSTEPILPDPDDLPECGSITVISDGIPCRVGREIRFGRNLIRLTVPRRCLGNPRWVRVAAEADHFVNQGQSDDIYYDPWDNHGKQLSPWLPPFGPRVRATDGATVGGGTPHPRASTSEHRVVSRHGAEIARR